jgi:mannose-6-phosphate isomerase-like protein (cupin superfamily)
MKPFKYSQQDTNKIDLGTKVIFKYPSPTKLFEIARMEINDHHPQEPNKFLLEHDCQFAFYVIKGQGVIYASEEVFKVKVGDVVFVPKENKFAAEGNFEYITVNVPAFYPEQSEEITDRTQNLHNY